MKKSISSILLVLFACAAAFSQSTLPDKADLSEIKGKNKVYVDIVDPTNAFTKAFEKAGLVSVPKAKDAEFFIEYRQIGETRYISSLNIPMQDGRMTIYYFNGEKKTIVWEDTASDSGKHPSPDDKLLKRFLKARTQSDKK